MKKSAGTFALIGHPLGHSKSPAIHSSLFRRAGLEARYRLCDIAPEHMSAELPPLLADSAGINVTIPHKQAVIPYLHSVQGAAKLYGAVNTIKISGGQYHGYNTDGAGFLYALAQGGVSLSDMQCVVIAGAGGAARVFAAESAMSGCRVIFSGGGNADKLAEDLACRFPGGSYSAVEDCAAVCAILDKEGFSRCLLINATPVGMYPHAGAMAVTAELISRAEAVFDAVYNPLETLLLRTAAEAGKKTIGGLPMLVAQAAAAHSIWLNITYSDSDIQEVMLEIIDN